MPRRTAAFPLLGLGVIVAGADKLFGLRSYERLFRHLGWSEDQMRLIGASEVAGGLLLAAPATRKLGGLALAAASAAVLRTELRRRDLHLALPRSTLLLAALVAVAMPRR